MRRMLSRMIELRWYQEGTVKSIWDHLRNRQNNPCAELPTGSGKTPVIAQLCNDAVNKWNGRVLVLAHVMELLEQAVKTLSTMCPDLKIGLYSSGLKSRQTDGDVIVAGIQSIYKKACEIGKIDIIIIDECHLINPDGEGMYGKLIADMKIINPKVRVIGLTATPFRLKGGMICHKDHILNEICYKAGVKELIEQGYLSPIVSKASVHEMDTTLLHKKMGEFIEAEMADQLDTIEAVEQSVQEIHEYGKHRKSALVFCVNIAHCEHVTEELRRVTGENVQMLTGQTKSVERAQLIRKFKDGEIKYLCNVNVLTTGFDAPNVDMVCLLRATVSPGLFYQIVGRGLRLSPGKINCLCLDFGQNVVRHGCIDNLQIKKKSNREGGEAPAKVCPECRDIVHAGFSKCPHCGYEFPIDSQSKHGARANLEDIISKDTLEVETFNVRYVILSIHEKKKNGSISRSLKVDYHLEGNLTGTISEWVAFESDKKYAIHQAHEFWRQCSLDMPNQPPDNLEQVVKDFKEGLLKEATSITVRKKKSDKYWTIVKREFGAVLEKENK
ncbi:hypothetical protein COB55_03020 [Candidatus Wolfebacteria bacterium]|nr:MAG: hypothetical protein COB55_03020 [Candidatus Wolfebacteria bacterium]